jgi:signal transduction histidine kinase
MICQGVPFLRSSRDRLTGPAPRLQAAVGLAGLLFGLGAEWAARSDLSLLTAGTDLAVGWTLIGCGLIAWSRRPQSRIGPLMALTGFAWFLGTFAYSDIGAVAMLGSALLTLHRGPLFHAIVGYPSGRISSRLGTVVVTSGYVYAAIVPLARNGVATIVILLMVLATTIRGYRLATGPDRQARVTAVVAAAAVALPLGVGSVGRLIGAGPDAELLALWGYWAGLVLIAVVFLVDLLRARWADAAVTRLVVDLGEDAEAGTLRGRLARALGDPSLAIAYWLPEANSYVDETGALVELPGAETGRAVTLIEQHGERIAALVHDATVLDDPGLIDAIAAAARIAFSNVRLQAEVRRHVVDLEASRRRIVEANVAQRRRLQQELRLGVGQRMAEIQTHIDLAIEGVGGLPEDRAAGSALEDAERVLQEARVELQELAAGIHPALLSEQGLGPALSYLAERAGVPVRLVVGADRLPAAIETAVYFVCSEALANVGKYARASRVNVEVRAEGNLLTVLIADDGIGGANPSAGSGLKGMADRIEALGGRLSVESPPGRGTRLLARIPTDAPHTERAPAT